MQRAFSVVLIPLVIMVIPGCGRNEEEPEPPAEPVVLELMVYANEGMLHNYEAAIDAYNALPGETSAVINNVYGEDWSDFDRTFNTYIHSGRAPDIVDVSVIYRDSMIRRGLLKDIMPYAEADGLDFDLYFRNQFQELMVDEALYGIPSGAMLMAVYYNRDLLQEAGVERPSLDWEETWTREEFSAAVRRVLALSTDERTVYGMSQAYSIGWVLPHIMSSESDFLIDPGFTCEPDDPGIVGTLDYLSGLMFVEGASPSISDLMNLQAYQFFIDGNLGFFVDGNWWMEGFRDSADFSWGILPMPVDARPATGMYVDFWAVPDASSRGDAAYELLSFFLEEDQQRSGIMKGIPPLQSVAKEIYRDRFPDIPEEELSVWFEGVEYGRVPAYFSEWNSFQEKSTETLQRLAFGDISPEEAAREICGIYSDALAKETD